MASVVGIGAAVFDILMTVDAFPREDTKLRGLETKFQCGGPCATGLVAISKLGESASYMGTVGDDMYGTFVKAEMERYGVDTSCVKVNPGLTFHSVVLLNVSNSSRTCVWNRGEAAAKLREDHCGGLDEQIGLCWGHSNQLNALEWHTCNEFNIAVRELVLLLAKREDLDEDGRLNADKVQAFYLAQGEMIEVYSDTLHFCPCEVTGSGFSCIVGLQRGTNLPIAPEQKVNKLWAANKWLLGHEANTGLIERGAFPGIYGENWKINPIR